MNVLITGCASGIGKEVASFLLEKNINVYGLDVNKIEDSRIKSFSCDVSNTSSLLEVHDKLKEDNVIFDAIINIAGIFIIDSFIEVDENSLKRIFDINLMGTINVNKIFFDLLKEKGRILITTSEVAPLDPLPFNGIYNVTKTALDSYAQALRQELNLLGYKVITIRPGAFKTDLSMGSLTKTKDLMQKTILYKKQSKKFYTLVSKFMGTPKAARKMSKTYYKALTKKKPKIVYKKNINHMMSLLSLLPLSLQCFIIKLLLK